MIQRTIYREEYSHYKTAKKFWNGHITRKLWDNDIFVTKSRKMTNLFQITNVYNKSSVSNILVVIFPMKLKKIFNKNYQNLLKNWELQTALLNQI